MQAKSLLLLGLLVLFSDAFIRLLVPFCMSEVPANVPAPTVATRTTMTRKRRRSRHPGVTLIKPDSARRQGWRIRYRDPDTNEQVRESLDRSLTTVEQREAKAIAKSRELLKRRMELDDGAPRATGAALSAVVARYYDAHPLLRPRTIAIYRMATGKLEKWAEAEGIASADALNRARLLGFREHLIAAPKRVARAKGKRGAYKNTSKPRGPASVNQDLRAVRTVLGYVRDLDLLPRLSHDDLRRALKRLPVTYERIDFLKPNECQSLIEAALRHDAATFVETRDEHAGTREPGSTFRHPAIAPLVAFVLLTGCRIGEALTLDWRHIDLSALDHDGRAVGEIHLRASATKTHRARTIGLEVSPGLRSLLARLRLCSSGKGRVFPLTANTVDAAAQRLRDDFGAPPRFTWQGLRRTCGTYLTNAPGIFGAASAYRSAKQLGHSVQVAERHYVDIARGIARDARSLEAAMQVGDQLGRVVSMVAARHRMPGKSNTNHQKQTA